MTTPISHLHVLEALETSILCGTHVDCKNPTVGTFCLYFLPELGPNGFKQKYRDLAVVITKCRATWDVSEMNGIICRPAVDGSIHCYEKIPKKWSPQQAFI